MKKTHMQTKLLAGVAALFSFVLFYTFMNNYFIQNGNNQLASVGNLNTQTSDIWRSPHGIFSIDGTKDSVVISPALSGLRKQIRWSEVETAEGVYDFASYDGMVDSLNDNGKQIEFSLFTLGEPPAWLSSKPNVQIYQVTDSKNRSSPMVMPWDPAVQPYLHDYIMNFCQHFDGRIDGVVMGEFGPHTETYMPQPASSTPAFKNPDGSLMTIEQEAAAWLKSSEYFIDTYATYCTHEPFIMAGGVPFPDDVPVKGTNLGTNTITSLFNYAKDKYGARFGIMQWGLNFNSNSSYIINGWIQSNTATLPAGFQVTGNTLHTVGGDLGCLTDPNCLAKVLDNGVAMKGQWIEVYPIDANNVSFAPVFISDTAKLHVPPPPPNDQNIVYALTVTKSGNGLGTVTSNPSGIDCGSICTDDFDAGTAVSLTASPTTGSTFVGWSGACSGTGSCVVTMDNVKSVTATFNLNQDTIAPTVSITSPKNNATVSGTITISGTASDNVGVAGVQFKIDGNNVGAEDTASPYSASEDTTTVSDGSHTLTAVARDAAGNLKTSSVITINILNHDSNPPVVTNVSASSLTQISALITWTTNENADSQVEFGTSSSYGQSTTVDTNLVTSHSVGLGSLAPGTTYHYRVKSKDAAGNLTVGTDRTFKTLSYITYKITVNKSGSGSGTVVSDPSGINCGSTCSVTLNSGTYVTLTATPDANSVFKSWTGVCANAPTASTCSGYLTNIKTVTAIFNAK